MQSYRVFHSPNSLTVREKCESQIDGRELLLQNSFRKNAISDVVVLESHEWQRLQRQMKKKEKELMANPVDDSLSGYCGAISQVFSETHECTWKQTGTDTELVP